MSTYASGILLNIQPPNEKHILNLPPYKTANLEEIPKDRKVFHETYLSGKTRSYEWRLNNLKKLKRMIIENQEQICHAAYNDFKDIGPVCQEICLVVNEIETAMESLKNWMKPTTVGSPWTFAGCKSRIFPEPLGTVLVISPWNFPISLSLEPVMGAISAGNCVVLKPSDLTPTLSALYEDLFSRYLDEDSFRVYNGGPDVATELLKQRWDHIFYTGNGKVGRIIMKAAAEHLTPVTLELGGKSPAIVDLDTIDVNSFAKRLFFAKMFNAGQVCAAVDYVLCLPQHVDTIVDAFKNVVHEALGDDPLTSPNLQRIVNDRHVERILNLLPEKDSKKDGEVAFGGRYSLTERKIEPTIIINLDPENAKVMKEEIFGPILPILAMNSFSECFDYIKSHDKPLESYLFTNNSELIRRFNQEITSGGQAINEAILHVAHPHLPFGGVGESGIGTYHGKHSFDTFSHHKSVLEKDWLLTAADNIKIPPMNWDLVNAGNFPKILRPSIAESFFLVRWYYNISMTFKWLFILIKLITTKKNKQ